MSNKIVLHFAAAGFLGASVVQLAGFYLSSAQTQWPGLVLFNWLSLFLSPFSLLFRLANPEVLSLNATQLLVIISANSLCCAIACRFLQITFARMSQKLQNQTYVAPQVFAISRDSASASAAFQLDRV
jgi:hypothetical protein